MALGQYELINLEELAKRTAIPKSRLYNFTRQRKLPAFRPGRQYLVEWGSPELEKWFEGFKVGGRR